MGRLFASNTILFYAALALCALCQHFVYGVGVDQLATLIVDASGKSSRPIPATLFGIFFEEINHAGAGGIWAELVSNRGFEAGGPNTPSNIDPWSIIGSDSLIIVSTDRSSPFSRNEVALRMDVLCDKKGSNICPPGGVGIYNPGYWGMNIEQGKKYKGHGFRNELVSMLADLKPQFIRFPGGSFVEGEWLRNAVRWRETIGPWEERPGHFGDVWMYWTDDGLGYFECLQDILDSIEFARGDPNSTWGSVRAAMGHPEPFKLSYVAVGNEDCGKKNYKGNYLKFYYAITDAYPDIQIISNCDGSSRPLDHPAHLYDFHIYTSANSMFSSAHQFDRTARINKGPKAFVSEYAVTGKDAGTGSLLAALAEGGFLIGLEKNSDVVEMASYAPLFVNSNDRSHSPVLAAYIFRNPRTCMGSTRGTFCNSGTLDLWLSNNFYNQHAYPWVKRQLEEQYYYLSSWHLKRLKKHSMVKVESRCHCLQFLAAVVNYGSNAMHLNISVNGLASNSISSSGSSKTVLTSANVMDENSFQQPQKVVPVQSSLENAGTQMDALLPPYSFTAFDLNLRPAIYPGIFAWHDGKAHR
ncbi:aspartate-semialdehyde dehydrogenase-like protein [Asimina triloba]